MLLNNSKLNPKQAYMSKYFNFVKYYNSTQHQKKPK